MSELVVVPVSPLNAPGLMTSRGWDVLREADAVAISCAHPAWPAQVSEAGVEAALLPSDSRASLARALANWLQEQGTTAAAGERKNARLAWLVDAEHPFLPSPVETVADVEAILGCTLDVDFVFASPVAPGSAVVESVRIMHELRSPGGDPWSAEQTHASLARYLLEETYEVLGELERAELSTAQLVDEFGDLLFQLVFHARIGTEEAEPWDLDSVARALNTKMYRRNPHIFSAQRSQMSTREIVEQWDEIKQREKPRSSLSEGIPEALPALQRAFKIAYRAHNAGTVEQLKKSLERYGTANARAIMALVLEAAKRDEDPESALRAMLTQAGL